MRSNSLESNFRANEPHAWHLASIGCESLYWLDWMEEVRAPSIATVPDTRRVDIQYLWSVCGYAFKDINIYAKPNWYQHIKMLQCVRIGVSSHSTAASGTAVVHTMAIIPNMALHLAATSRTHILHFTISWMLTSMMGKSCSSHISHELVCPIVHEYEKLLLFYCMCRLASRWICELNC